LLKAVVGVVAALVVAALVAAVLVVEAQAERPVERRPALVVRWVRRVPGRQLPARRQQVTLE
jgi:hypothetical protein